MNENIFFNNNSNLNIWINHPILKKNIDYTTITIDNFDINIRKPTKILYAGNITEENNHVLYCGNIKQLCLPEKKVNCFRNIKSKIGYLFILPNNNGCKNLISNNIIY